MMGINYNKWLNGNDCGCHSIKNETIEETTSCNCDDILLELSKLHTDDNVLSGMIENITSEIDNKLDASAYTKSDLSNYYTKDEVDNKIDSISSGDVDLTDYYTKDESNNRFQLKGSYLTEHQSLKTINGQSIVGSGNIVIDGGDVDLTDYYTKSEIDNQGFLKTHQSLDNYYTKDEVDNKGYLTEHQSLNGYATKDDIALLRVEIAVIKDNISNLTDRVDVLESNMPPFVCLTQAEYDALQTKKNNVLYLIIEE